MLLRRKIENIVDSKPNEFKKIYLERLANRIENTIRPSSLTINDLELKFETNIENNLSLDFSRSFFSFTIDKAYIQIKDEGGYLTVIYEIKFLRILILVLFPVIIGSIGFTVINGLKVKDFILTCIVIYGSFTLMILLFALISLVCLQHILIEEIDLTEKTFRNLNT